MGLWLDDFIGNLLKNPKACSLTERDLVVLCQRATELLLREPALLSLKPPLIVAGDTHGQFTDLLRIFRTHGYPPKTRYLFLGDYVDRGPQSIETVSLLLALKLKYPGQMFLLRGNHETAVVNRNYGFLMECRTRFNVRLWKFYSDCFNALPFAAIISERIFCMHGGISKDLTCWDQILRVHRPCEVEDNGVLCDLLWADPNPDRTKTGFTKSERGVSFLFSPDAVVKFCADMNIDLIVRAHQVVEHGYEFFANQRVVTVFSAPNYCGTFNNDGAVLIIGEDLRCSFFTLSPQTPQKQQLQRTNEPLMNNIPAQQLGVGGLDNAGEGASTSTASALYPCVVTSASASMDNGLERKKTAPRPRTERSPSPTRRSTFVQPDEIFRTRSRRWSIGSGQATTRFVAEDETNVTAEDSHLSMTQQMSFTDVTQNPSTSSCTPAARSLQQGPTTTSFGSPSDGSGPSNQGTAAANMPDTYMQDSLMWSKLNENVYL